MTAENESAENQPPGRRGFLGLVTTAGVATGAVACAIPFVESLQPQDSTATHLPVDVDIAHLAPGQQMTAVWQGKPVFIIHRTAEDLARLQDPTLIERLRDPHSDVHQQPDYTRNWHRSVVPDFGVYVGICTHLGCVPAYMKDNSGGDAAGGLYGCPCHGSRFDLAGRVFKGVPAPYNLPVPPYVMPGPSTIRLGENPAGQTFDFGGIVQI